MTKSELMTTLANETGLKKKEIETFMEALTTTI